ncbi:MAG TPA: hypothetical protein VIR31_01390, partial [Nitrososphaeraceae archaeon]
SYYISLVGLVVWPSNPSGCTICLLAMKNSRMPKIASTMARPSAPPFGTATKYASENTMHVNPCKVYLIDSRILPILARNPMPKIKTLG